MYDERIKALELALRSVLAEAQTQGLDIDSLCHSAMQSVLGDLTRDPMLTVDAMLAIEVAADGLEWVKPPAAA